MTFLYGFVECTHLKEFVEYAMEKKENRLKLRTQSFEYEIEVPNEMSNVHYVDFSKSKKCSLEMTDKQKQKSGTIFFNGNGGGHCFTNNL